MKLEHYCAIVVYGSRDDTEYVLMLSHAFLDLGGQRPMGKDVSN